jgi:predicted Rossmann fold flavoprotein
LAEKTAKKLNMPYRKMLPALLSLKSNTKESAKWAGIRTRGKITLYIEEKAAAQKEGELQLIERGISGIPVFQISRYAVRALEEKKRVRMQIDFLPSWEKEKLLSYFQRQEKEGREKKLITSGLLPEKLAALFAQKEKSCLEIVEKIKSFCIEISAYGDLLSAQAECGGVLLRGLSPEMESRSCPGLYVIGEAADVDGSCGGYNLQWAWSSGKAAGVSAAGKIEEKEEC